MSESHPAFGGFVKWNMNMNAGIKLNLYHGEVSGRCKFKPLRSKVA